MAISKFSPAVGDPELAGESLKERLGDKMATNQTFGTFCALVLRAA
jgi:hypothetical protein